MSQPITTALLPDGTVHIALRGAIDGVSRPAVRRAVGEALVALTPSAIVVDLRDVTELRGGGLGTLLACYHAAAAWGVRLSLCGASPQVAGQLAAGGSVIPTA